MSYDEFGSRRELSSFFDNRSQTDYSLRKQRAYEHFQSIYRANAARADLHLSSLRSTTRPKRSEATHAPSEAGSPAADPTPSSESRSVDVDRVMSWYHDHLRDPDRIAELVRETFEHHANRNFASATKTSQSAVKYGASNAELYVVLGNSFLEMERYGAAIDFLNRAIKAAPARADAHYMRGFAYESKQRWEDAYRDYSKAARLDADYHLYAISMAEALMELDRYDDAIAQFQRILDSGVVDADLLVDLGICHEMGLQYEAALAYFDKALELDSTSSSTLRHRGRMYLELGNPEGAYADFLRAVAASEDEPASHRLLGLSAHLLGKHQEAVDQLGIGLQLDSSDYVSRIWLGLSYVALDEHHRALEHWRQAEVLAARAGDTETADTVSKQIRKLIGSAV